MAVSKHLVQGSFMILMLAFSANASGCRQTSVDNAVNEQSSWRLFQSFKSGDLSVPDENRISRRQVLHDKDLSTVIEKDNNQSCDEITERFQVSNETDYTYTAYGRRTSIAYCYTTDCLKLTNNIV